MATQKRTFPNQYFAWYNDDKRLAVLALDLTTDSTESTNEPFDTFQDATVLNGLRIIRTKTLGDLNGKYI
jgi:hypothetical protein